MQSAVSVSSALDPRSNKAAAREAHSLKHGFHNKRYQSESLKATFPAGFYLEKRRGDIVPDKYDFDSYLRTTRDRETTPAWSSQASYMSWTKGSAENELLEASDLSDSMIDTNADMAGPNILELLAARANQSFQPKALKQSGGLQVVSNEVQLRPKSRTKVSLTSVNCLVRITRIFTFCTLYTTVR